MKHSQTLDLDDAPIARSDMELVEQTRSGDKDAFGELWTRHYHAALRAARAISFNHEPEDLAQEAFARIYHAIRQNRGPKDVFRAYLYTVLRSVSINWSRNENYDSSLDDIPVSEEPAYSFEGQVVTDSITARAFATLKPEWRAVLWYMAVEEMKAKDVAPMMGLNANATSALAYRAREALRSAWLQAHLNSDNADAKCKWSVERLGAYNRDTLPTREKNTLQDHLVTCLKCSILVNEVEQISKNLGIFLLPVLLGPAAFSYLDTISQGNYKEGPVPPNPVAKVMASSSKITLGVLTSAVTTSGLIAASIFMFSSTSPPTATALPKPAISASPKKTQPSTAASAAPTAAGSPTATAALLADPVPATTAQRPPRAASISDMDIMIDLETQVIPIMDTQPSTTAPRAPAVVPTVSATAAPSAPATDAPSPSPSATPAPSPAPSPTATPSPQPTQSPSPTAAPSAPATPAPSPTATATPTAPVTPSVLAAPSIDSVAEQGLFLPLLQGTGVPGATVTVLSSGESAGSALVDSSGSWSAVPDMTLASSASVSFMAYQELDGLVSATTFASAQVSLATPEVLSVEYTNGAGNVSIMGPPGSTVEVIIDGNPTGNLHLMDGSAAVRRLSALSPGKHSLTVRFVDKGSTLHGAGLYMEFDVPPTGRVAPTDLTDSQKPA